MSRTMRSTSCESDNTDAFEPAESPQKFAPSRLSAREETSPRRQDTDVIDAHCAEGTSLCGGRHFVDLDDHAAS